MFDRSSPHAERKLREQIEKTRRKEAEKAGAKEVKLAQTLLSKIEPAVASLEALLNHNQIAMISETIVAPVKQSLDIFYQAVGLARRVIKDGRATGHEELMSIKDFSTEVATCNKAKTLLTQMLAACNKAGRS